MQKIKKYLTPNNIFLIIILLIATFLRFYNLPNNYMFMGDQGRDALVVANIFKEKDPVFIGPVTSIGNMYLGPFYYYFMLPFLFISYPNPIGPVYAVAALSVITVALVYLISKKMFNNKIAIFATIFFALSSTNINLARFSWNPNPAPFFSLLMFYFTYLAWKKDGRYWLLVSAMFSILAQLHYVTLLSLAGAGIIFLIDLKKKISQKNSKQLIKFGLLSVVIFLLSLTPLLLFDLKHDWRNINALKNIVVKEESFKLERKEGRQGINAIAKLFTHDLRKQGKTVLFDSLLGESKINYWLMYISLAFFLYYIFTNRDKLKKADKVLFAYLFTGIEGLSLYQHDIYTHYFAYLLPMVAIFQAYLLDKIKIKKLSYLVSGAFLLVFIVNNLKLYNFANSGWGVNEMRTVAKSIHDRVADGEKYNIVLLSESKDLYGMNYRYFLSTMANPPVKIEDHHQAEKLFIINEEKKEEDLLDLNIYEIAVFPEKNILEKYQLDQGPEISVLGKVENNYNE